MAMFPLILVLVSFTQIDDVMTIIHFPHLLVPWLPVDSEQREPVMQICNVFFLLLLAWMNSWTSSWVYGEIDICACDVALIQCIAFGLRIYLDRVLLATTFNIWKSVSLWIALCSTLSITSVIITNHLVAHVAFTTCTRNYAQWLRLILIIHGHLCSTPAIVLLHNKKKHFGRIWPI